MKLINLQVALFTTDLISRPDLLFNNINDKLGGIFDSMPMILNLPLDVPAEIPVVQAKSSNDIFAMNVSRKRVDLFINPKNEDTYKYIDFEKKYGGIIEKYWRNIAKSYELCRIGIVATLFMEHNDNINAIYSKYLKGEMRPGTIEVTLRTNYQSLIRNIVCNNIFEVQAATLNIGDNAAKGVLVKMDTNNTVEHNSTLPPETISEIIKCALNKIKNNSIKGII